jgi:hypothetical protein
LELVPEVYNPWDSNAIATDVNGERFGYVAAEDALIWHDVIRAANRAGFSVWSTGELETYDGDEGTYRNATVSIPLTGA